MSTVTEIPADDRTAMTGITRRALLSAPIALGATRRPEAPALPGGAIRAGDDDAERLEALLDQLRQTWPVEAEARKALERIAYKGLGWEEAFRRRSDLTHRRNRAHNRLAATVLEVAGARDLTEDQWGRFGLPWAVVATDRHLFVVHATDQSEYYEDNLDMGMTELVILDL